MYASLARRNAFFFKKDEGIKKNLRDPKLNLISKDRSYLDFRPGDGFFLNST